MAFGAQECVPRGGDKYCWLPETFEGDGDIAGPGVRSLLLRFCGCFLLTAFLGSLRVRGWSRDLID